MKKKRFKIKPELRNYFRKRAVFLDRDGTINYDSGYTYKFSEFRFRPYILKGLKYLSKKKYLIFIVTNQAGIAKGKFKLSDLLRLHKQLKFYLKKRNIFINDIQFCPYHPRGVVKHYKKVSGYRKPGNLMIKKIFKNWQIDLKKSFMIGNSKSDELAAKKSTLYFEYVKKNFYYQVKKIERKVISNY